ncbi:nickel ABC transporter permease subunit NikB [Alkalihalophilus pseudofirmus]|nr:nickel ABC transporter permease subunit NikB [Alkalihalophilus pseudofirmus]
MLSFIVKRILIVIPIILGITLLTFFLIQLVPGDPAEVYLRLSQVPPTEETIVAVREELGLDQPLFIQYGQWLISSTQLDFGVSFVTKKPVLEEVIYYFPETLKLTIMASFLTLMISIPVGILSAFYKNRFFDQVTRFLALAGNSMPTFWLGFLLMYVFSLQLGLLPAVGTGSLAHYILPTLTLAIPYISIYSRLLRTSFLENMNQPFVLYSSARGIKKRFIYGKHVLKHSLLPVVTGFGVTLGYLLGGTVIVESVFSLPGVGRYFVSAILNRDYPVIQFYVLFMAVIFTLIHLIIDVIYAFLDPRIHIGEEGEQHG